MSTQRGSHSTGLSRREAVRLLGAGAGILAGLHEDLAFAAQAGARRGSKASFPKGAIIRTILKDVPPDTLGKGATLFHEHISIRDPVPSWQPPPKEPVTPLGSDINLMVEELKATGKDGVSCIVNAGTKDLGQNIEKIRTMAQRSGIHIVLANGYWTQRNYPPEVATQTEDEIAEGFIRDAAAERWGALGEIGSS